MRVLTTQRLTLVPFSLDLMRAATTNKITLERLLMAQGLIAWAFEEAHLQGIFAHVLRDNTPSHKVLEKAGAYPMRNSIPGR